MTPLADQPSKHYLLAYKGKRSPLFKLEYSLAWNPQADVPYWRVQSRFGWGPWCPSRLEAIWLWLKTMCGL